jgi:hypothetical protein
MTYREKSLQEKKKLREDEAKRNLRKEKKRYADRLFGTSSLKEG